MKLSFLLGFMHHAAARSMLQHRKILPEPRQFLCDNLCVAINWTWEDLLAIQITQWKVLRWICMHRKSAVTHLSVGSKEFLGCQPTFVFRPANCSMKKTPINSTCSQEEPQESREFQLKRVSASRFHFMRHQLAKCVRGWEAYGRCRIGSKNIVQIQERFCLFFFEFPV